MGFVECRMDGRRDPADSHTVEGERYEGCSMDWSTRRHVLRVHLKTYNWWWKWPFIATTVAVWVVALVLVVAPWDRAGSEEYVDGLPAPTTPDPKPDDGPTNRVSSWSTGHEESSHRRTTATKLPTVKAPAKRIVPEQEPAATMGPAVTMGPTTTIGPTRTGAPPSTSSPATTTAPASPPALDTPGPATSTTTTTQPAVVETTAAPTTTKATGKPGRTGQTDDEELPDTKNGKAPPGQQADKTKD